MFFNAGRVAQLAAGRPLGTEVEAVYETLRQVRGKLAPEVALIGFCGAPWTVATYLIEGGSSAERVAARVAAFRGEGWLDTLIDELVSVSIKPPNGRRSNGGAEWPCASNRATSLDQDCSFGPSWHRNGTPKSQIRFVQEHGHGHGPR